MISGNMVGMYSTIGKTLVLTDEDGKELTGVIVDQEVIFTAGDNDVRQGKVYAADEGVSTGTKDIPAYRTRTTQGFTAIPSGSAFSIKLPQYNQYDYTKLQCMIAPLNTSINDSYAVEKIVLDDGVYITQSVNKVSTVTKNETTQSIDLNIINESSDVCFIYFFTYREEI